MLHKYMVSNFYIFIKAKVTVGCDNNATTMSELSEGMSVVASTAASSGVGVDQLTAALGTMAAVTQQSGSEVARAFKAILLNIKQVSDNWLMPSNQFAPYVQKCA